ncbi:helix-turn-helix domain-containing protein [Streptomyces sp. NPDC058008]|uniref:helix-turn-helix domain-containing protein n=1 Tax=Streptomyces sp. NPDC058008 TaxID=3346303 RepID=UPI0036E7C498
MTRSITGQASAAPLPSPKERRRLREARALTEQQVAAAVGVTPATVRAWETGRASPRGRRRAAYVRLIGCAGQEAASPPPAEAAGGTPESTAEVSGNGAGSPAETDGGAPEPSIDIAGNGTGSPARATAEGGPRSTTDAVGDGPRSTAETVDGGPRSTAETVEDGPSSTAASGGPAPDASLAAETPGRAGPAPARGGTGPEALAPEPAAAEGADQVPAKPGGLTAEEAYDALYGRTAPGLTRQMYLLTGRRKLAGEAVEHAFRIAWQRWPEVARDRDPAGWVRAASYEYAMSPWHRMRRTHRRADPLPDDPARRALFDVLLGLPPSYRRTLLLHDGVGLGLPETAAETESSTLAAAGRLVNARAAVADRLPRPAEPVDKGPTGPADTGGGSVPLHGQLAALALAEEVPAPPPAPVVRARGERVAELWTRAALCFGALLVSTTVFTLHTAPTRYEQPLAPAEAVGGVPPLGGPEKLTPQDLKLRKALKGELAHGPERLVPHIP